MKKGGGGGSVMVYAATTRQSQLVFYVKTYLWKMFTRQFQSGLRKVLSLRKTDK